MNDLFLASKNVNLKIVVLYERGFQHMKVTPLVLPSLDKGIYGAKPSSPDF
jgi:hypothetical protein